MRVVAFGVIAVLLLAAIAVQVRYAQMVIRSGAEVGRTTKFVWGMNVVLLLGVLAVLGFTMISGGAG